MTSTSFCMLMTQRSINSKQRNLKQNQNHLDDMKKSGLNGKVYNFTFSYETIKG